MSAHGCLDVEHQTRASRRGARALRNNINMALLTEGGSALQQVYKHSPPDRGPTTNQRLPSSDVLPRVPLLITPVKSESLTSVFLSQRSAFLSHDDGFSLS